MNDADDLSTTFGERLAERGKQLLDFTQGIVGRFEPAERGLVWMKLAYMFANRADELRQGKDARTLRADLEQRLAAYDTFFGIDK